MAVIVDIESLYRSEQRHAAELRKIAEDASFEDKLRVLYDERIALGQGCDQEAKRAEADGIDWNVWCANRLPFGRQQADKYRRVFHARNDVKALLKDGDLPYDLNLAVKYLPTQADSKRLAYANGGTKRDPDDWQTPEIYIEAARRVLGTIDFDPFSSAWANERVRAKEYYSIDDDAYITPWPVERNSTIWMNPPYGRGAIQKAVAAFLAHIKDVSAAIVLVNNATDTQWAHDLNAACSAKLETAGRIQFERPEVADKVASSNTRGQVFYYFGDDVPLFAREFSEFGFCWRPCGGRVDD